jgi:hypothetical protein
MNVTSVEAAQALLGKLPLDDAKLMEFDFIETWSAEPAPPTPLTGLGDSR